MNGNELFMHRCLELAQKGKTNVAPNPLVGCVIVCENKIIGEGYHVKYGEAHAEVNAIHSVKDKSLLRKSKLFVNLEPCSHWGKTPPCTDLINDSKIPEVFIGCKDTNKEVNGAGIKKLVQSGCKVVTGLLEKECKELNARFFTFHEKKRPYIILKWAQTLDGFIDMLRQDNTAAKPNWITSENLKMLIHKWRTEEQAIIIGTNAALLDNPMLNVRDWYGKSPLRIVIDRELLIPITYNLLDQQYDTVVFTEKKATSKNKLEFVSIDFKSNVITQIMEYLYNRNILSAIVEGGSILLSSFLKMNLWDEARVFIGSKLFYEGLKAPEFNGKLVSDEIICHDRLLVFKPHC